MWAVRNVIDIQNDKAKRAASDKVLLRDRSFTDCVVFAHLYLSQHAGGKIEEDLTYILSTPKALYLSSNGDVGYIMLCVQEVFSL